MRRITVWLALAVVLLALGAIPASHAAQLGDGPAAPTIPTDIRPKIQADLLAQWDRDPSANQGFLVYLTTQANTSNDITDWKAKGEYVLHQLETVANATQPAVMQVINAQQVVNNVTKATQLTIINAIFVHGNAAAASALARHPNVAYLDHDHSYQLTSDTPAIAYHGLGLSLDVRPAAIELGVSTVHAPQVWALGYRGQGITVGSIDTGVQYDHPALVRQYRGNLGGGNFDHNYNWWDARQDAPRQNVPYDDFGHGTHTMGTVLGEDAALTNQIGVAPGAQWIAAKVFPNGGSSGNEELAVAQDFMLAPWDLNHQNRDPSKRPQIVTNSWGDNECWNTDSWLIVKAWIDAGIIPVFANGNAGPGVGTVGSPGGYPFSVGVGAIQASTLTIAGFSSRGPSCYGGIIKPDVVAPGVNVRSSVPTNGYGTMSGTSMATPHTSGVVALLLSVRPSLTYSEVFSILTRTTYFNPAWGVQPNNNYGWGLIQADLAVDMAMHGPMVLGTVTGNGSPLQGAQVTALRTSDNDTYSVQTGGNGGYHLTMRGGTYDVTASAFGYNSQTMSTQSFLSNTTTTLNLNLTAATTYPVSGRLLVAGACTPLSGTVSISPPGTLTVTASGGLYTAQLPPGTYTLTAHAGADYQPIMDVVTVTNAPLTHDFNFVPAHDIGNAYYVTRPAYNWIPGTTALTFTNNEDGHAAVPLPFAFTYYGTAYSTLNVSTNGFATFNAATQADMWANTNIPNPGPTPAAGDPPFPNNAIYPYWDDLAVAPRAYGVVYSGVSGTAPNRIFVVEWRGVAGTDAPITFEIQLEESTGAFSIVYQFIGGPYGYADSATVGIENATGSDGIQLGWNQKGIVGDLSQYRFVPGSQTQPPPCGAISPTPTVTVTVTETPASVSATPTPPSCTIPFTDVDVYNPFYIYIRCLYCRGIVSGYNDNTFHPYTNVTRGQAAKILANAAALTDVIPSTQQTFTDVPYGSPFWLYIEQLHNHGYIDGYNTPGVCDSGIPCFLPSNYVTRGQLAKIDSNAAGFADDPGGLISFADVSLTDPFYVYIGRLSRRGIVNGYDCGSSDLNCVTGLPESCGPGNLPYYRPCNFITRGQTSKVVSSSFFPLNCAPGSPAIKR